MKITFGEVIQGSMLKKRSQMGKKKKLMKGAYEEGAGFGQLRPSPAGETLRGLILQN